MIGSTTPCPAEAGFRPLRAPLAHFHAAPARPAAISGEVHQRAYPQIEFAAASAARSFRHDAAPLAPGTAAGARSGRQGAWPLSRGPRPRRARRDRQRLRPQRLGPLRSRPAARAASRKPRAASAYAGPRPRLPPAPTPGKHDRGRLRRHLLRAGRGRHCGIGKLGQAHPGRRRARDQEFEARSSSSKTPSPRSSSLPRPRPSPTACRSRRRRPRASLPISARLRHRRSTPRRS